MCHSVCSYLAASTRLWSHPWQFATWQRPKLQNSGAPSSIPSVLDWRFAFSPLIFLRFRIVHLTDVYYWYEVWTCFRFSRVPLIWRQQRRWLITLEQCTMNSISQFRYQKDFRLYWEYGTSIGQCSMATCISFCSHLQILSQMQKTP